MLLAIVNNSTGGKMIFSNPMPRKVQAGDFLVLARWKDVQYLRVMEDARMRKSGLLRDALRVQAVGAGSVNIPGISPAPIRTIHLLPYVRSNRNWAKDLLVGRPRVLHFSSDQREAAFRAYIEIRHTRRDGTEDVLLGVQSWAHRWPQWLQIVLFGPLGLLDHTLFMMELRRGLGI